MMASWLGSGLIRACKAEKGRDTQGQKGNYHQGSHDELQDKIEQI